MADASQNPGEPPVYPYPYPAYPYGYSPQYPPIPHTPLAEQRPSPYAPPSPWAQPYPYPPSQPGHPPQHGQQPPSERPQAVELAPDSALVWAVLALVLTLCNPVGMALCAVAIAKSNSVAKLWTAGQRDEARNAARQAKMFALYGFLSNLLCACVGIPFGLMTSLGSGS